MNGDMIFFRLIPLIKLILNIFFPLIILATAGSCSKTPNYHPYTGTADNSIRMATSSPGKDNTENPINYKDIAVSLLRQINNYNPTGDRNYDYTQIMIILHKSAIELSDIEATRGKDSDIIEMAKDFKSDELYEINHLDSLAGKYKNKNIVIKKRHEGPLYGGITSPIIDMCNKALKLKLTGDPDVDYVTIMILQEQAAVKMADSELRNSKDPGMKTLINDLIEQNMANVQDMQDWLRSRQNITKTGQ